MAEKKITLDIVLNNTDAVNNLKDIKDGLKLVNNELLKTKEGTEEYANLSTAAGKLKDKIGDLNDTLKTTQGSGLEKFKNSLSLIREGFTNLDPGKLKIGIQGATQAFGGLGKAIAATGIGLLVVGIVKLIQNFDELKKVGGLVGKVFTAIGDTINFLIDGIKEFSDSIGLTNFALAEATEAEKKYGEAIAETNRQIGEQRRKQLVLTGKLSEEEAARQNAKEKFVTDFLKIQAEARQKIEEDSSEAGKKKIEEERQAKIKLLQETYVSELLAIRKGEKDKADAQAKAQSDAAKKLAEDRKKLEQQFSGENELERLNRQEKETLAEAKRLGASEETLLNIRQEFFNRRLKLADDSEKEIEAKTVTSVKSTIEKVGLTIQETPLPPLVIPVITPIEEVKNFFIQYEEQIKATLQISEQFVNALSSLNDLVTTNKVKNLERGSVAEQIILRKSFERNKKLAIAGAVISGIQGVVNALTAKSTIPEPFGTALKIATAVSVAAATAVNIAKIAATKFESSSPPSAGGGGGGGVNVPTGGGVEQVRPSNFSLFGTGGSANNLGANEPQMIQAYVVESQVTSTQRRVERFRTAGEI